VHQKFLKKHDLIATPKVFQLYGYGNYDEQKASLKIDFEEIGVDSINGKYLYDKTREVYRGKLTVKLNGYYKEVLLNYIGYRDLDEFLEKGHLAQEDKEKQLELTRTNTLNRTDYYINYYFGEDSQILKGEAVISNNFKKIEYNFLYPQADGSFKEHRCLGNIIRREDTIHIYTKNILDGKVVEGPSEIYYIGHNDPSNLNFLIGTYSGYDLYTHVIAGKTIMEKCNSQEEMIERSRDDYIHAHIVQEIRNQRIQNPNVIPNSLLELSDKSPYSSIYEKLRGTYHLLLKKEDITIGEFKFKVSANDYRIEALQENVYIESDDMTLMQKGSVVHFKFEITGIINFGRLEIYLKTYFLSNDKDQAEGVFCGIDNENRLINGSVTIGFRPNNESY